MQIPRLRRMARWGGALALGLTSALAAAQDGAPPTGPPVTRPATSKDTTPATPSATRPVTSADVLPGIPATARDPAPPGTRSVRVDRPNTGAAPAGGGAMTGAKKPRVLTGEGVVTRLDRAGKTVSGELERFAFDPSQDWTSFANRGATGVADKDDERPKSKSEIKEANEKQHEDDPDKAKVMEMVITRRTVVYTHARSADGTDLHGVATASTPDTTTGRNNAASRNTATGPRTTNFTNIKEGSFVSVRYRKVGDVNEVLNLTLIEMPLNPEGAGSAATATSATSPRGTAAPTTSPAGAAAPGARVPTVPLAPAGADLPR